MADVFISYSKADREKVVMLAAYLESEGWTVWWDMNLAVGDTYRDEIMKQLAAARAVIVLWTQNSIKSDFVRAEAGRAKADSKLIPVKESDVTYGDIPLPFGEMHTEDLSKHELIRAAVVAQLAKPAVQPNLLWMATRTLRYQVLTWVGIVGGAITLFANLQGFLLLAGWVQTLVSHWHEISIRFWQWVLGWIGIKVPVGFVPYFSFALFGLLTAFGARRFDAGAARSTRAEVRKLAVLSGLSFVALTALSFALTYFTSYYTYNDFIDALFLLFVQAVAVGALSLATPIALSPIVLKKERVAAMIFAIAITSAYSILFLPSYGEIINALFEAVAPFGKVEYKLRMSIALSFVVQATCVLLYAVPTAMLWICPAKALNKRMLFLAIGFLFLTTLNQLSYYTSDIRTLLMPPA